MDGKRFDDAVKRLSAGSSRRAAARVLAGSALGAMLARVGLEEATAGCGKVGARCTRSGQCCEGGRCASATCRCRAGRTNCRGHCRNLQGDDYNCGTCGNVCRAPYPFCCGGVCVSLASDEANCGACGRTCPEDQTCCNGDCVDLQSDYSNCGACGGACGYYPVGHPSHDLTRRCCGGTCTNIYEDEANCGACGRVCPAGQVCRNWEGCVCPEGFHDIDGTCVRSCSDRPCPTSCGGCSTMLENTRVDFCTAERGGGGEDAEQPCTTNEECPDDALCAMAFGSGRCRRVCTA